MIEKDFDRMNEAISYQWADQACRGLNLEPHVVQALLDRVASAIREAYRLGRESKGE